MIDFYKTLLYSLPEIVYHIDINGNFVYVNESIQKLGYSPEELLGRHFTYIVAEDYHAAVDRDLYLSRLNDFKQNNPAPLFFNERRTGGRITRNLKVKLISKIINDGAIPLYVDAEVFATGLYSTGRDDRNYTGTIGVIRDLSEDVEYEKTLLRIERFYRLLIDHSLDVISILAHDGTVLYVSNSLDRNLGMKPIDLIGENISEITHPDDIGIIRVAFSNCGSPHPPAHQIEFRCRHADLTWRTFETSFICIMDAENRTIMCYILHSIDITRRRNAELSLAKRERIYKQLLRTSPDGIALFDREGDLIMANDKAAEITGQSREDLIGKKYLSFIRKEDRPYALKIKEIIDLESILLDYQFILLHAGGENVPVEMSIASIKDDAGGMEGYIAIFRDITNRKKIEAEQELLKQKLKEEHEILSARNYIIENDLRMAHNILANLIPSECFFPGIAFYFKTIDIIGGDFYDFIRFGDQDKVGVFICDVAGHGLPAAFITSMIKTTINQAGQACENPAELLSLLNDMLIPLNDDRFVTAYYAIYDSRQLTITYSRAGHNHPYRIMGESVEMMSSSSRCIPLGIYNNNRLKELGKEYINETISVEPGEKILFYTDGLSEAIKMNKTVTAHESSGVNPRESDFGSSRLKETMKNNSHLPPRQFLDSLMDQLVLFRGSDEFEDDICLICLSAGKKS